MAQAAPGDLDPSFSADGRVTTDLAGGDDRGFGVAIQADGKIVVAGSSGSPRDFALARYNPDGSLDTSFDVDGRVTTDFGGDDSGAAVAIQSDGKIVVAGTGGPVDFALARYNADGSLDTGFSGDGRLTTDFLGSNDVATGIALQSDGKIVAVGEALPFLAATYDFAVARYNTDGSLDNGFDADGRATTDFTGGDDFANGVAIQGDGKIVAAGSTRPGNVGDFDFALARYNANGSLDSGFSGDGRVTTDLGGHDSANGVAIQADGKIVAAGTTNNQAQQIADDFLLARYNTDGSLDSGFSGDGLVTTDFNFGSSDQGNAVGIQTDGKILVAGSSSSTSSGFALARYNADGSLDSGFSGDGLVTTGFGGAERATGIALQSDGKIVLAGQAFSPPSFTVGDFAVAVYLAAPTQTGGPDVGVSISDDPDPVSVKQPLTYTITASNVSTDTAATNVTLTDPLPARVKLNSVSANGATCTAKMRTITCSAATLAAGAFFTVTIQVTPPNKPGTLSNTATVSDTGDVNAANDSATATTTVNR